MSFFKKLAASAGIGAAKVETILEKDAYYPGEEVRELSMSKAEKSLRTSAILIYSLTHGTSL